jgi:glycerophosphoryl diester phosphodiesterase
MRKSWILLGVAALAVVGVVLFNASFWARPAGALAVLSHRGVHHDFPSEGLTNDTCTAARIYPPTHAFIENSLPSMQRAFDLGADMVEIDIHPTTDGEFAVFHDWGVECRTNGQGVTRELSMTYLRTLDIGYGYTADGGQTFPLRGQGVGMMPTLREVLAAFPQRRFLINFKSNDPSEAGAVLAYLDATPNADLSRLAFYGAAPADRVRELRPDLRSLSRARFGDCALSYALTGWFGRVGAPCQRTILFVPRNYGGIFWGWPNRFLQRMQANNTEVYISDDVPFGERLGINGVDDAEAFARLPRDWRGGVATDRIEVIAPLVAARNVSD